MREAMRIGFLQRPPDLASPKAGDGATSLSTMRERDQAESRLCSLACGVYRAQKAFHRSKLRAKRLHSALMHEFLRYAARIENYRLLACVSPYTPAASADHRGPAASAVASAHTGSAAPAASPAATGRRRHHR